MCFATEKHASSSLRIVSISSSRSANFGIKAVGALSFPVLANVLYDVLGDSLTSQTGLREQEFGGDVVLGNLD